MKEKTEKSNMVIAGGALLSGRNAQPEDKDGASVRFDPQKAVLQ